MRLCEGTCLNLTSLFCCIALRVFLILLFLIFLMYLKNQSVPIVSVSEAAFFFNSGRTRCVEARGVSGMVRFKVFK